ncbi:MAG: hypothetical protein ABMA13_20225 [Chthoniobacteraceae bacterium]
MNPLRSCFTPALRLASFLAALAFAVPAGAAVIFTVTNNADSGGGAIYSRATPLTLKHCTFLTGTEPSPNALAGEKPSRVNGVILQNYMVPGAGFGIGFGNSLDPTIGPSLSYLFPRDLSLP